VTGAVASGDHVAEVRVLIRDLDTAVERFALYGQRQECRSAADLARLFEEAVGHGETSCRIVYQQHALDACKLVVRSADYPIHQVSRSLPSGVVLAA